MSQITIGGTTLNFKDSSFTGDQWEQVASWVLNGGAEGIDANAQIATEKAAAASASAASARNSATSAGGSASAAARSAARAEGYNSEAQSSAKRAATSATNAASSERNAASSAATANGAKYNAESAATEAAASASAAKQSENYAKTYESSARSSANNAGASERKASTYASSAAESIKHAPRINADGKWELWSATTNAYVATEYTAIGKDGAAGTDGITPTIGANGNWYLGETDTGLPSRGEQGPGAEVFYIDLEGSYPDYTCPVAMADIKAAYEAGNVLTCRCAMGRFTATLPLFVPMPSANTWIFSGAGALTAMSFPAQSLTIAIVNGNVQASNTQLTSEDDIASPTQPGLVQPVAKTDAMTRSIGVDNSGALYSEPAAWYVNITGALDALIGDKTPAEIYQAYTEGYAVYAVVQLAFLYSDTPFILPLASIIRVDDSYMVCFSTMAEPHRDGTGIIEITVTWNQRWYLFTSKIASTDDIPTTLKNPHALTIKTSSDTVSYDGSEAKTMEIADAGELVTETTEILPAYTNQIPLSTDVSGAILKGVGYESGQLGMDGSVTTGTSFVSGFIPVKKGDVIRVKDPSSTSFSTGLVFALYNSSKATGSNIGRYINTMQANASYGAVSISGNVLTWDTSNVNYYFWNNFAYLRVTTNSAASIVTVNEEIAETTQKVMTLKPTVKVGENNLNFNVATALLAGKKVVVFGDSIIGMTRDQTSVPAYAATYTGATIYNVGFGGCRMSVHPTNGYAAFSMWALADAVSTGDYTMQNAQASSGSDYFPEQLALLKTINFNDVDMVVIHYGTNDFAANVAIDNASDDDDTATLCGALRYSLRKLMTAYPKLRIFVSVPIYRKWNSVGAETYTNSNGVKLIDFCEAMARVATEFNCPVMNGYRALGINTINDAAFSADGTHLNDYGRKVFGQFMGGNLIAPVPAQST